ncbi:CoA-binding protein [bacterium]|nr:CoA-binding protein [bacterium]
MASQKQIEQFINSKTLAVVGVSRHKRKFGNTIFNELSQKGYTLFPVNPNMSEYGGLTCYPSLSALPQAVDGVVMILKPNAAMGVLKEAREAGIKNVWLQQGAGSDEAETYAQAHGINLIRGQCILMYAPPVKSIHKWHSVIWKWLGVGPK